MMKELDQIDEGSFFEIDIGNYYNAIWCIVVTMATGDDNLLRFCHKYFEVGYGDFAPKTIPGRSIGFLACISGSVFVSLLVLGLDNLLKLSSSETNVMSIIDRITIKKKRRKQAAFVILYFTKLFYLGKKQKEIDWKLVKLYTAKMQIHLHKLAELKRFPHF